MLKTLRNIAYGVVIGAVAAAVAALGISVFYPPGASPVPQGTPPLTLPRAIFGAAVTGALIGFFVGLVWWDDEPAGEKNPPK